jgi:hypothetical protein
VTELSAESVAVRHSKRGKAHRAYGGKAWGTADKQFLSGHSICGMSFYDFEVLPLSRTAPEDRCKICWPAALIDGDVSD